MMSVSVTSSKMMMPSIKMMGPSVVMKTHIWPWSDIGWAHVCCVRWANGTSSVAGRSAATSHPFKKQIVILKVTLAHKIVQNPFAGVLAFAFLGRFDVLMQYNDEGRGRDASGPLSAGTHHWKRWLCKEVEARHDLTGLPVAVKIINKLKMKNKNMISKVTRQIKILKFISHPNIIKLYEVLDTTNDIFVVMEMAQGGQLYEYIQKRDLSDQDVRMFFRQIIDGVEYAHLNLVSHRDLKPQNILLNSNRVVKIADFGLSNLMKDGKLLRTSCGSLNYAAPEIIGHRPYEGTALDVWSCGVILFTMLTGTLPFEEEVTSILYKKIETADYSIPDYVNPLAADLISRMLQVNPCRRIRVSQIKLHPWLRKELPIYAHLCSFSSALKDSSFSLDSKVMAQLKALDMPSLKNITDVQRIGKIIRKRMDDSFVTVYELIKDEKDRAAVHERCLLGDPEPDPSLQIFSRVPNKLQRQCLHQEKEFVFGESFSGNARRVVGSILGVFVELQIDYVVKNNQYCLLCMYYPPSNKIRKKSAPIVQEEDKIYGYQDEHRFTKHQLKFTLQLYSRSKKEEIVVDLKLTQGHPFVFIPFARRLYRHIRKANS